MYAYAKLYPSDLKAQALRASECDFHVMVYDNMAQTIYDPGFGYIEGDYEIDDPERLMAFCEAEGISYIDARRGRK